MWATCSPQQERASAAQGLRRLPGCEPLCSNETLRALFLYRSLFEFNVVRTTSSLLRWPSVDRPHALVEANGVDANVIPQQRLGRRRAVVRLRVAHLVAEEEPVV